MNFENQPTLYKERASAIPDISLEKLLKLNDGEAPRLKLEKEEREQLFEFENKLGEELEKIDSLKIISSTFYMNYFLTPEGKTDFENTFDIELTGATQEELAYFILKNRSFIGDVPAKMRTALIGRSEKYANQELHSSLFEKIKENGELEIEDIHIPQRIPALLSPQKSLEKITGLRNFKNKLLELSLSNTYPQTNLDKAKSKILQIYKRKTNALIASIFNSGVIVQNMANILGEEMLETEESDLLKCFSGLKSFEKNYSRFDKFIHGASPENHSQISKEIRDYSDKIALLYLENETSKKNLAEDNGLDYEKLEKENISCEEFSAYAEQLLEHYGQKSSSPSSDYNPDREGPAPDDKWQFIARPEFTDMAVNSKQKIIRSGTNNKNIKETIAILLGHEIEGHFIQNLNTSSLPLRLFKKMKADRIGIFSEGGAMFVEDYVSREAFGCRKISHPHYVRAMIKKIEGANYLECVKTFYESALEVSQKKKSLGLIDDKKFKDELSENLKLAINRVKRLFKAGVSFEKKSSFLATSGDALYLEQTILAEKLKENGLEKYLFLSGINLDVLVDLLEIDLIDPKTIQAPDFQSLEIWKRLKNKYEN